MTNKEWIDFLSEQWDVSRTTARNMLHDLYTWKKNDDFNRRFDPLRRRVSHEDKES